MAKIEKVSIDKWSVCNDHYCVTITYVKSRKMWVVYDSIFDDTVFCLDMRSAFDHAVDLVTKEHQRENNENE